jgi:hypothetical protein
MLQHGGRAHRVRHKNPCDWTWNIGGRPRSGTVDRLYKVGLLQVLDRDTLELSAKACRALGVSAETRKQHLNALRACRNRSTAGVPANERTTSLAGS